MRSHEQSQESTTEFSKRLGRTIRIRRLGENLRQQDVADALTSNLDGERDVAQSYVSKVEKGITAASWRRLEEMSAALHLSVEQLLFEAVLAERQLPPDIAHSAAVLRAWIGETFSSAIESKTPLDYQI